MATSALHGRTSALASVVCAPPHARRIYRPQEALPASAASPSQPAATSTAEEEEVTALAGVRDWRRRVSAHLPSQSSVESAEVARLMHQMKQLLAAAASTQHLDEQQAKEVLEKMVARQAPESDFHTPHATPKSAFALAAPSFADGRSALAFADSNSSSMSTTPRRGASQQQQQPTPQQERLAHASQSSSPVGKATIQQQHAHAVDSLDDALQQVLARRSEQLDLLKSEFQLAHQPAVLSPPPSSSASSHRRSLVPSVVHDRYLEEPDGELLVPQMLHGALHTGPVTRTSNGPSTHQSPQRFHPSDSHSPSFATTTRPSTASSTYSGSSATSTPTSVSAFRRVQAQLDAEDEIARLQEEVSLGLAEKAILEERIVALTELFVHQSGMGMDEEADPTLASTQTSFEDEDTPGAAAASSSSAHSSPAHPSPESAALISATLDRLESSEASLDAAHRTLATMRHSLEEKQQRLDQLEAEVHSWQQQATLEANERERLEELAKAEEARHADQVDEILRQHEAELQQSAAEARAAHEEATARLERQRSQAATESTRLRSERDQERADLAAALEKVRLLQGQLDALVDAAEQDQQQHEESLARVHHLTTELQEIKERMGRKENELEQIKLAAAAAVASASPPPSPSKHAPAVDRRHLEELQARMEVELADRVRSIELQLEAKLAALQDEVAARLHQEGFEKGFSAGKEEASRAGSAVAPVAGQSAASASSGGSPLVGAASSSSRADASSSSSSSSAGPFFSDHPLSEHELTQVAAHIDTLTSQLSESEKRIRAMEEELREERRRLQEEAGRNRQLEGEIQRQLTHPHTTLLDSSDVADEEKYVPASIATQHFAQLEEVELELQSMTAQRDEFEAALHTERADFEERAQQLAATIETERAEFDARSAQLDSALTTERAEFEHRCAELEATVEAERAEFEERSTERESALNAERAVLEQERAAFDDRLQQLVQAESALAEMRSAWEDAMSQLEAAQREYQAREKEWRRKEQGWQAERADLRAQLAHAESQLPSVSTRKELLHLQQQVEHLETELDRTAIHLKCKELECSTLTRQMADLREDLADPASVRLLTGAGKHEAWGTMEILFAIQMVAVAIFAAIQAPIILDAWNDRYYS